MSHIITLTTDFGNGSPYVAQMKGAILSILPEAKIVDITHNIPPQDVRYGALVLEETAPKFPRGTIHICVVDPGVGTDRNILAAIAGGQRFVLPDNGLLTWVAQRPGVQTIVRLTERRYWLPTVSATFHGRDIMAPAAAHWSRGEPLDRLGEPLDAWVRLPDLDVERDADGVYGEIVAIDSFGNLITNIRAEHLPAENREMLRVSIAQHQAIELLTTYGQRPPDTVVALLGSSDRLEIAVVQGNAARVLKARVGDRVTVRYHCETHGSAGSSMK